MSPATDGITTEQNNKDAATAEYELAALHELPHAKGYPETDFPDYPPSLPKDLDNGHWNGDRITQASISTTPIEYPRRLITPAGYVLGPHGEGWQSGRSSVSRYPHDYSTLSSPRRDNLKNLGFGGSLVVPKPRKRPDYHVVAEYQGLKLGRISDAVPYLLGPRSIIDRIQSVLEHESKFPTTTYNESYLSSSRTPPSYTPRDKALIAILSSLRAPEFVRLEKGDWYAQGLAARYDALLLYKHTAKPGGVETSHITLAEFHQMAQIWVLVPNPALVYGDFPHAKNAWIDIAAKLRERDVDVGKIDMKLYEELTLKLEGEELVDKIEEVARWAKDGTLEQRYNDYIQATATQDIKNAFSRSIHAEASARRNESKRFAHKYPQGTTVSQLNSSGGAGNGTGREMDKEQAEKRKEEAKRARERERAKKKRNKVFFVAFMILLFGGAVGSMLWAMGTRRWDFTQGGGQTG